MVLPYAMDIKLITINLFRMWEWKKIIEQIHAQVRLLSKDLLESKVRLCIYDVHPFYTKVQLRVCDSNVKSSFLAGIILFDPGKETRVSILNEVRSEL
jgi:hypothetical protein